MLFAACCIGYTLCVSLFVRFGLVTVLWCLVGLLVSVVMFFWCWPYCVRTCLFVGVLVLL